MQMFLLLIALRLLIQFTNEALNTGSGSQIETAAARWRRAARMPVHRETVGSIPRVPIRLKNEGSADPGVYERFGREKVV